MTTDVLPRVFRRTRGSDRCDMVDRLSEGDAAVSQLAEPYRMTLQARLQAPAGCSRTPASSASAGSAAPVSAPGAPARAST